MLREVKMKNCKWCNDVVKNSNCDECDRCWELRWQCEVVPELVAKILSASNNCVQADGAALCEYCGSTEHHLNEKGGVVPNTPRR